MTDRERRDEIESRWRPHGTQPAARAPDDIQWLLARLSAVEAERDEARQTVAAMASVGDDLARIALYLRRGRTVDVRLLGALWTVLRRALSAGSGDTKEEQ